jgi:hypothetical protein
MKKLSFLPLIILGCMALNSTIAQSVTIKKTVSYAKGLNNADSRVAALLSNNTIWWCSIDKEWQQVPSDGLPKNEEIIDFEVYQKSGLMSLETRYMILTKNNTIWWYADKKDWEQIETTSLPKDKKVKDISVFNKGTGSYIQSVRIIAVLDDNSIWWYANTTGWQNYALTGLPIK